jgi:soluble lytic murein transglycosylase-like protein
MKALLGAVYLTSSFFMFALHAETLDAPTLVYQDYKENFIVRQGAQASKHIKTDVARVRTYLVDHMKETPVSKIEKISRLIVSLGRQHGIPPGLILTIVKVESNFNSWAVSPRGALGLMQLMPETGAWQAGRCGMTWSGPAMLLDEEQNLSLGIKYLAWLKGKYNGDLRKMLSAYNRGPARVDEDENEGRNPTLEYYHKIKQYLPKFAMSEKQDQKTHVD